MKHNLMNKFKRYRNQLKLTILGEKYRMKYLFKNVNYQYCYHFQWLLSTWVGNKLTKAMEKDQNVKVKTTKNCVEEVLKFSIRCDPAKY